MFLQIKELVLDNCARCTSIQGLTDEFCNLRVLSIINVGLQSLAKFPKLPKLRKVIFYFFIIFHLSFGFCLALS
jgi:hypothetical protein